LGGVKKKSMASMEKKQETEETPQGDAASAKGKKTKDQKAAPQQRKQFAFLPPKMNDAEVVKTLTPLKAITVSAASRALGVNSSVAGALLRDLQKKSLLTVAGGFSGHRVWTLTK
jgi:ribosomal protein S25